jgi:uncharacterized protein
MQFVVTGHDGTDAKALERRLAARPAHMAGADAMKARGELLYAAAILNDKGEMAGSVMICEFPSRKEVDAWLAAEPYVTGKVWEKIDVRPAKVPPSFAK